MKVIKLYRRGDKMNKKEKENKQTHDQKKERKKESE